MSMWWCIAASVVATFALMYAADWLVGWLFERVD